MKILKRIDKVTGCGKVSGGIQRDTEKSYMVCKLLFPPYIRCMICANKIEK